MRRAFLSVSFHHRQQLEAEFEQIINVLRQVGIEAVDFVIMYPFRAGEERAMMKLAMSEIAKSDLLIAEVSEKAIGVGIEVGCAAALGKPVIYLHKTGVEYSTTVGGLAAETITYDNLQDLHQKLAQALLRVI
jgi:nucleoside 2-deoxyribosyltransferase